MFKRRRTNVSNTSSGSNNVSCVESKVNSACNSYLNSPTCTNAFIHGTGWSPLLAKNPRQSQVKTPNKTAKPTVCTSVPMTPLTLSQNHFKTPQKQPRITEQSETNLTVLTPKIISSNSPYTSSGSNTVNKTHTQLQSQTQDQNKSLDNSATFWSYPNLSLSQLGLDSEPPLPLSDTTSTFYNIFNSNDDSDIIKLPELFQGTLPANLQQNSKDVLMTRMSPLSWLLSVSSQDSSLGLFDQSQQILSEYLSLQK